MLHTMSKGASAWYTPQIDGHAEMETPIQYFDDNTVVLYCSQLLSTSGWCLI